MMIFRRVCRVLGFAVLFLSACSPEEKEQPSEESSFLEITEADIQLQMVDGLERDQAKSLLEQQLNKVESALKAGVAQDPETRDEIARLLINRHRELVLKPKIKSALESLTEERLREIYQENLARFHQAESRQVAVLWLDPGADPDRKVNYLTKLKKAREWLLGNTELIAKPELGFSTLSIDHSQYAASRYQGGVIGWVEKEKEGRDLWSQAIAEIAFSTSDVSQVIDRPEGIFLVRVMQKKPARILSFEGAREQLRKQELARLRKMLEAEFEEAQNE